jgi:hypothetical protein
MMFAALPTQLGYSKDRLAAVHEGMGVAKDRHGALPAGLLADASQFALPATCRGPTSPCTTRAAAC